jgi:O-methyltransferase
MAQRARCRPLAGPQPGLREPDPHLLTIPHVGGGSGAHSIGAALKFPRLQGIVFDAPPVCEVAAEFIAGYELQTRIRTHAGDMWTDPFPPVDVHFYSFIYHDWTPEKCRFLTRKSFESLRPGVRF